MKLAELLLVEDNPEDVYFTLEVFKRKGICNVVHVAKDGVEATSFLRRESGFEDVIRPDIVFLDLHLPKKSGIEVLAEIKSDPSLMTIPVVILTTSESEKDVHQAHGLKADWYITKPVSLDQLVLLFKSMEQFGLGIIKY